MLFPLQSFWIHTPFLLNIQVDYIHVFIRVVCLPLPDMHLLTNLAWSMTWPPFLYWRGGSVMYDAPPSLTKVFTVTSILCLLKALVVGILLTECLEN